MRPPITLVSAEEFLGRKIDKSPPCPSGGFTGSDHLSCCSPHKLHPIDSGDCDGKGTENEDNAPNEESIGQMSMYPPTLPRYVRPIGVLTFHFVF
jgi:hypothetical protein